MKYFKDFREETSDRSFCSQKSKTAFLTEFLNASFGSGVLRRVSAGGSEYIVQSAFTWVNQDLGGGGLEESTLIPCFSKILFSSLDIIERIEN